MPPVTRPTTPRVPAAPVLRAAIPRQRSRPAPGTPLRSPSRTWRSDLAVALVAIGGALWVTGRLWLDPAGRGLASNGADQVLGEWLLRLVADAVTHGRDPFYTHLVNAPTGVNLADNTATTLLGTLLIPVTLLFGAPAAFVAGLAGNLAASAYAWYHLLSRHVARSRGAAVLSGLFCGFAPAMVSHANGHLNFTAQWLVPVLL